ncbi:MAG: hypothetical protein LUI85_02225 [Bacteroides sp.]|nr:hypothetical protein [Bacteroides sp.]
MKIIQAILICSLALILFSCDNDDNTEKLSFNVESLKQTRWAGTFEDFFMEGSKPTSRSFEAGIIFVSKDSGDCSLDTAVEPFKYTVNGKVLSIQSNSLFKGNWLLVNQSQDRMVLEKGTGGEGAYKAILTLTRTH